MILAMFLAYHKKGGGKDMRPGRRRQGVLSQGAGFGEASVDEESPHPQRGESVQRPRVLFFSGSRAKPKRSCWRERKDPSF